MINLSQLDIQRSQRVRRIWHRALLLCPTAMKHHWLRLRDLMTLGERASKCQLRISCPSTFFFLLPRTLPFFFRLDFSFAMGNDTSRMMMSWLVRIVTAGWPYDVLAIRDRELSEGERSRPYHRRRGMYTDPQCPQQQPWRARQFYLSVPTQLFTFACAG